MGVDLSILDLVHVEKILVGLNSVEVNVVDTILCRIYSVCRLNLILQVLLCASNFLPLLRGRHLQGLCMPRKSSSQSTAF